MLELQVREIGTRLSGDDDRPVVAGGVIVEAQPWADSTFDLLRGLDVAELVDVSLPLDPADLQAP